MIEFGSDFHYIHDLPSLPGAGFSDDARYRYFANGRQSIQSLIMHAHWRRIWIPAYYCYDVISSISGVQIVFYDDHPLRTDDDMLISNLPFRDGDVLLRINYFGMRGLRTNKHVPVPVIEDHTHDLMSAWAKGSDAMWCMASVRKTLPVAAGGVLWSPINASLPEQPAMTRECEMVTSLRYEAMKLKTGYLCKGGDKGVYREKLMSSEALLGSMKISGMDLHTRQIVGSMDVAGWTRCRTDNWRSAVEHISSNFNVIQPECITKSNPFSIVMCLHDNPERDAFRRYLIDHCVYPAILWQLPSDSPFAEAVDFSERMLSVHCDSRYSTQDIEKICGIINSFYD